MHDAARADDFRAHPHATAVYILMSPRPIVLGYATRRRDVLRGLHKRVPIIVHARVRRPNGAAAVLEGICIEVVTEQGGQNPLWLALRVGRITGSAAGAALGVNPYDPALMMFMRQWFGEIPGVDDESTQDRSAMDHGTRCEPFARAWHERVMRVRVEEGTFCVPFARAWRHVMGYSDDGRVLSSDGFWRILAEYKNPVSGMYPEVLIYYMTQIQMGMYVLQLPESHFVVCVFPRDAQGPDDLTAGRVWRVPFSPAFWAWMAPRLQRFMQLVRAGVPPSQFVDDRGRPVDSTPPPRVDTTLLYHTP